MADALDAIRAAIEGLEYPGERDVPFDLFHWPAEKEGGDALEQAKRRARAGQVVEEVAVDDFFAQLEDSEDADRFHELRRSLESALKGLRIFRVGAGERRVDIYLLGQTSRGEWAGVHAVSIET